MGAQGASVATSRGNAKYLSCLSSCGEDA